MPLRCARHDGGSICSEAALQPLPTTLRVFLRAGRGQTLHGSSARLAMAATYLSIIVMAGMRTGPRLKGRELAPDGFADKFARTGCLSLCIRVRRRQASETTQATLASFGPGAFAKHRCKHPRNCRASASQLPNDVRTLTLRILHTIASRTVRLLFTLALRRLGVYGASCVYKF